MRYIKYKDSPDIYLIDDRGNMSYIDKMSLIPQGTQIQQVNDVAPNNALMKKQSFLAAQANNPATSSGTTTGASTGATGATNPDPQLQQMLDIMKQQLDQLQASGKAVNPNIQITPEIAAQYMTQAANEIDPYYATQLNLAKNQFLSSMGFSQNEILTQEKEAQRQYGSNLRSLGESLAEQGFAYSGKRLLGEQDLATSTQNQIDAARRQVEYNANQQAGQFAQQWGGQALPQQSISEAPRVIPGQQNFQQGSGSNPYYTLSPSLYDNLVGEQTYNQRVAKQNRQSQLESAWMTQQQNNQRSLQL